MWEEKKSRRCVRRYGLLISGEEGEGGFVTR